MIFGDLVSLTFSDICLTGEEKSLKNLTQETCPVRGSNPGPLNDRRACYRLLHSEGAKSNIWVCPGESVQFSKNKTKNFDHYNMDYY